MSIICTCIVLDLQEMKKKLLAEKASESLATPSSAPTRPLPLQTSPTPSLLETQTFKDSQAPGCAEKEIQQGAAIGTPVRSSRAPPLQDHVTDEDCRLQEVPEMWLNPKLFGGVYVVLSYIFSVVPELGVRDCMHI